MDNTDQTKETLREHLHFTDHDRILTAYGEHAMGPGWANEPLWVIVRSIGGDLRLECIQPEDQPPIMCALFDMSAALNTAMVDTIERALRLEADPQ